MAISIDGKTYRSNLFVKYGEKFPKVRRSETLNISGMGVALVYLTYVGTPEWDKDFTVKVPIEYYITEITKPSNEYKKKQKKNRVGLRLVRN